MYNSKNYLILIFTLITLNLSSSAINAARKHALIVDAGSSGSRIFLMGYDENDRDLPEIKIVKQHKIKPGIATLVNKPVVLSKYLDELFDSVLESYKHQGNKIPVIFHMTAGARLLEEEQQNSLVKQLKEFLKKNNFTQNEVEIISGETEGIYSWVAINYMYGTFEGPADKLVNVFELGGASAQNVYSYNNAASTQSGNCIKLNARTYDISAKSYLGLGNDKAHLDWKIEECDTSLVQMDAANQVNLADTCRIEIKAKLQKEFPLKKEGQPGKTGSLVALGYYHHLFEELDIPEYNDDVIQGVEDFLCSHSERDIAEEYPLLKQNTLEKACFDIVYADELLKYFGATNQNLVKIHDSSEKYYTWAYASLLSYLEGQTNASQSAH